MNENLNIKWLPALIVVILFISGLIIAGQFNLPTVSKNWGSAEELDQSKEFTVEHLTHLSCFSKSMGFVRQMKEVDGILGVDTHIDDHKANITYDTTKIDEVSIRKMLYTRLKQFIKAPSLNRNLTVHKLHIAKYLTRSDLKIMAEALQNEGVYQLETQFDTEIRMLAFCDAEMSEDRIEELISSIRHLRSNPYGVKEVVKSNVPINGQGLMKRIFRKYRAVFNDYKSYPKEQVRSVLLVLDDFPKNENKFKELSNHVAKKYKGVVGIDARYEKRAEVRFFYIQGKVDPKEIIDWASQDEMSLVYSNGETEQVANPYKFKRTK